MYQRIISLAPSNTEILYALGAQDKLVACTRYCDFPEEAKKKSKIGGWLDINDDLVKKFKPDLILTSTFVQNKITRRYKKNRMNIISLMPTTLKGVFDSIIKIGKLVEKGAEANELVNSMRNKFEDIQNMINNNNGRITIKNNSINENNKKINNTIPKPRVYIEEWH
ncbi:ABC transporter substrate-binding protein, partial [Candidatus Woesearchaeota archaeon]|nr:ABC transporter substrate-binding protein [Candidatus Woesearchaeota archaeon]